MLSQTALYAVRAMAYLAKHGRKTPVLSQTIAEEMQIPKNFLSKILNRLVQEHLVVSTRGAGGGFLLTRDPRTIRLREVAGMFMNIDAYRQCFLGRRECDGSCRLHKKWLRVQRGFEKILEETTIADVL
jgi:Rrf2 family protein